MAIDLEAIKKRVKELNGDRKTSSVQLWKPELGEYRIRGLPWQNSNDGMPFIERWFYYIGDNYPILAPNQFGKPDPINDLIKKLHSSGKPDDKAIAKKLYAKMRAYMRLVVRGQEDKGVQLWAFGKPIYQRLLSFFTQDDIGDFLDPIDGFDLTVNVTHVPGKMFKNKPSLDTAVDAARRPTKLSNDSDKAKSWLDSVTNVDDVFELKSTSEIESVLNAWLSSDEPTKPSDGTSKNSGSTKDDLDKLVDDTKSSSKTNFDKTNKKSNKKDNDVPVVKTNIDDVFAELDSLKDDDLS